MRIRTLLHSSLLMLVVLAALLDPGHGRTQQDPENAEQTLWSTYWTVEPGFTSTLEMKNNRVDRPLYVQVSLYFANGEEYYLERLHLEPRQTVVVNLNQVYESLPAAVRARVGKEGAVEVSFRAPSASSLMGGVSIVNPERGIAWNFRLYGRAPALPLAPLVGAFWFYDSQSDGFVAMQNVSDETVYVTPRFYVNGAVHTLAPIRLWSDQVYKLELGKELRNLGLTGVRAGGIELAYQGPSEAVVAHGALFNRRGFSAEITFLRRASGPEEHPFSVRTPRVAIGPADPRLGLPASASFEPLLALANLGESSLSVRLTVGFQTVEGNQELELPVVLEAREARVIRLADQLQGILPPGHWASLEVSYVSREAQLAAGVGSVSQDGQHSLGAVLNHVEGSVAEGWYWQIGGDSTTLLGILNADSEEATVQIWLDYTSDGQAYRYDLPETVISGRSTALIDLSEYVGSGLADADGDVIPAGVTFGGYRVRKVAGGTHRRLTTEALLVNRRTKTFLPLYNTCCGYTGAELVPKPLSGSVGSTQTVRLRATNLCSGIPEFLPNAQFSSSNSSVASVSGVGVGTVSFNNPGSATITGTAIVDIPDVNCNPDPDVPPIFYDNEPPPPCCGCSSIPRSDSTSASVSTPTLNLSCPASVTRGQGAQCTASVTNVGSNATITFTSWKFTSGPVTVNRSCTSCPATWSGTMATSGTVAVTAKVNNTDLPQATRTITITNRNWHTNPASPTQVPNGTIVTLPVPPQPNVPEPGDSGLGVSEEQTGNPAFSHTTVG
ncbi:MAG: hypothetical protein ACRD4T_09670, partial [Candidatus Acidiferrales bacterium]